MKEPRFGAPDEEFDELDFAKDALSRISIVAADLAARQKSCVAGCLAAKLWIARKSVDSADASQLPRLQRRLPKLIDDLERVCAWPHAPNAQHPILRSVINPGTYRSLQEAETRACKGISAFANGPPAVRDGYFKKLDQFSRAVMVVRYEESKEPATKMQIHDTDEYPPHVNSSLYSVLRAHSLCTCTSDCGSTGTGSVKRHPARLRLRDDIVKVDGCVAFDLLLSASPTAYDYWQDLQVRVTLKDKGKKSVKYMDGATKAPAPGRVERSKVISPGSLCSLVTAKLGSRICCRVQDPELHQLYDGSPIVQQVDPGPSISLRGILQTHRLSNRMKLVLAYIISRSFWQYYDSPWMGTKWTSDSIHFLREPVVDDDAPDVERGALYASSPYFVVEFSGEEADEFVEYCDSFSVIYRYPRLLALCILLLEIGRGESLSLEDHGSMEANLNSTWTLAKRLADKHKAWGDFDYPDYRKAVLNCLSRKLFEESSTTDQTRPEMDIFTRKAVVYKTVVQPLENLLKLLGFSDKLKTLDPIDSRGPGPLLAKPPPPALPTSSQGRDSSLSSQWLDKLANINSYICNLSRPSSTRRPVRIAILDTGYDDQAIFFQNLSRTRRIKQWRDWAENSETPVDENGHGTHTVALVMKVAPTADIYVARIAKDRTSLRGATGSIAEAIHWAATDCEADIISMSFGFQEEIPVISRAIDAAELHRDGKILFFAAASNSGANRKEAFPATHDSVISIRETNSNGAFSDSNPPVDPNGPIVLGTLGKDVPSAWLSNVDGEVARLGSSVATAVAAGVAAMVLMLATAGLADPKANLPPELAKLWTRRGMLAMLTRMSQNMGNRSYFISPVGFFSGKDSARIWNAMADVCVG